MKAAVATENGLVVRDDVPQPTPNPTQVLVRVRAAALNRADLASARGAFHGSGNLGKPIGLEWAGDVVDVGTEVKHVRTGDKVMGSGNGGYAEYAVSDIGRTLPMPAGMDYAQACGLSVALMTMHDAVVVNGRLTSGDTVLIQGASSGVGLMGMMIAKLKGAHLVIGSSTNAARRARLAEFGADLAIDSGDAGWVEQALDATGGNGVSLIVDMLSGPVANQNLQATALTGRIVNVGRLAGANSEFNFDLHAMRRIDYIGVTFRTRTVDDVRALSRRMQNDIWDAVAAGKLNLPIDKTFRLDEAPAAHAHMSANAHFGKIVLLM